jgi:hypothetical protein
VGTGKSRDVATASLMGSGAGLLIGSQASRGMKSEGHAAAVGVGHWWGTALAAMLGIAAEPERAEDFFVVLAAGGGMGAAIGMGAGRNLTMDRARSMHLGGLVGALIGLAAAPVAGSPQAFGIIWAASTGAGLLTGATAEGEIETSANFENLSLQPFMERRTSLYDTPHTIVGFSADY